MKSSFHITLFAAVLAMAALPLTNCASEPATDPATTPDGAAGRAGDFAEADGSKTDLNQLFIINSSPTFLGYDYLGSDANHHYFVAKWKFARDDRFKVKTTDLTVKKPMPFGKGSVEVFPYKPTTPGYEEFGKIADNTKTSVGGKTLFRKK